MQNDSDVIAIMQIQLQEQTYDVSGFVCKNFCKYHTDLNRFWYRSLIWTVSGKLKKANFRTWILPASL
jgi:hypothetical protein